MLAEVKRKVKVLAFWLLSGTGFGLYLFARSVMSVWVLAGVTAHLLVGLALAPGCIAGVRKLHGATQSAVAFRLMMAVTALTGLLLIACAALAIGMSGRPLVIVLHVAAGALAVGAALAGVNRLRFGNLDDVSAHPTAKTPVLLSLMAVSAAALGAASYKPDMVFRLVTSTNAGQAGNAHFPGGTRTDSRPWSSASIALDCAENGCHPTDPHQALTKSHERLGQVNLVGASITDPETKKWCAGCHSPVALLAGVPKSTDSGNCLNCHSMQSTLGAVGNGNALYTAPSEYPFHGSKSSWKSGANRFALRLRPEPHKRDMIGEFDGSRKSEYCQPCHSMTVGPAQNHFRHVPIDNTWQDWAHSGMSGRSAYSAVGNGVKLDCGNCHMGNLGGSISQVAPGPEVSVDIFALREIGLPNSLASPVLHMPLDKAKPVLTVGTIVQLDVVVYNKNGNHLFPTISGLVNPAQLELTIHGSGSVKNEFIKSVHRFGKVFIDADGKTVDIAHKDQIADAIDLGSIPSNRATVVRYQFQVPYIQSGNMDINVTIKDRKRKVFGEYSLSIAIGTRIKNVGNAEKSVDRGPNLAETDRYISYGEGLMARGDNGQAVRAFQSADKLFPELLAAKLGIARASIAEGDLLYARKTLENLLGAHPDLTAAKAWLGRVLLRMGQHKAALEQLSALTEAFPLDSELWTDIGQCWFLSGDNERAIEAFQKALAFDSLSSALHYDLMQAHLRLKHISAARQEEALFNSLREDIGVSRPAALYLKAHPKDATEQLPGHVHVLQFRDGRK